MSKEKYTIGYAKAIIAKFMGYDIVDVGYAGSEEETEWQRNHEKWMKKVGLTKVGRYVVDVKQDEWYPFDDLNYHSSWELLMPVWKKAGKVLFDIRGDLNDDEYLTVHRITKAFMDACQKVEIERAHEAVYNAVQFIQWYQANKQKEVNNER